MDAGRYFLHEHPKDATSWNTAPIKEVMRLPNVRKITADMCAFGMVQEDELGTALIKKPTGFMSNSPCIINRLKKNCTGDHRHILLVNGRAKRAQVYPDELCKEIVCGLMDQMRIDGRVIDSATRAVCAIDNDNNYII